MDDEGNPADGCLLAAAMGGMLWIVIWKVGEWAWTTFVNTP